MAEKLRCGIIGCGVIAPVHASGYQGIEDVELAWACDLVPERAAKLAEKYGIARTTTDYQEMLADPSLDAISVCTDHASHAPITVAALEAGKHVLCEKALAASGDGLRKMLEAGAARDDLVFGGVFQHRFDAVNRIVRRLVGEGAFGTLLTACVHMRCLRTHDYYRADTWRGTWAEEGGAVLINQTIHFLDAMLWITGGADAVCGAYANLTHGEVMETEDTVVASFRLSCGALATLEATASSHLGWEPTIEIHGTEGSVELRGDSVLKIKFADPERAEAAQAELEAALSERKVAAGKTYYGSGHPAQIADFVRAVRDGGELTVPAPSAGRTVEAVFGIYQSHRSGKWVLLDHRG